MANGLYDERVGVEVGNESIILFFLEKEKNEEII